MSFWDKVVEFFTWIFQGSKEKREERELMKKYNAQIKVSARNEYVTSKLEQEKRVAREKAKIEANRKIEHIKAGGWLGKAAKAMDNASKNFDGNGKGKKGKKYEPINLFPEPKNQKPIDFSKIL